MTLFVLSKRTIGILFSLFIIIAVVCLCVSFTKGPSFFQDYQTNAPVNFAQPVSFLIFCFCLFFS